MKTKGMKKTKRRGGENELRGQLLWHTEENHVIMDNAIFYKNDIA